MPHSAEAIEKACSSLERFVQEYFNEKRSRYAYGDWFEPIYFDLCEYIGRKGKRIRPQILMISYFAFGGKKEMTDPSVLKAALAMELLHTFILMHDDVIDRSDIRRGLPTFHKLVQRRLEPFDQSARYGENIATVLGDMVFAMSVQALNETEFPPEVRSEVIRHFLDYAADTGAGEILDILLGTRDISRVDIADIEDMYYLKTTRYTFEAPCILGAVLAGASEQKVIAIKKWVRPLGLAFQIDNDLIEFRHLDVSKNGFPTDLLDGKKTVLIHEAYNSLDEVDRSFLQMCLGSERKTESTLIKIYDLIRKSGAIDRLAARNSKLFDKAEVMMEDPVFDSKESSIMRTAIQGIKSQIKVAS
ncbi:MAG: polyprenyl synthetase family protein [Verrucomicrobiota bacterium]